MSKNLNLSVQSIQDALRTYLDNSFLEEHEDLRGGVANLVHYTPYQVWWEAENNMLWCDLLEDHLEPYISEQKEQGWNNFPLVGNIYLNCIWYILSAHGYQNHK